MSYKVEFSDDAIKDLKRIDKYQSKLILAWIKKNLVECSDPRLYGKALKGDKKRYWRYRIGAYRAIAEISDKKVKIFIIHIAHRSKVYES